MKASRRGFLASLCLAPLVGRFLPKAITYRFGPFLATDVWDVSAPTLSELSLSWYDERTGKETPVTAAERPKGAA